MNSDRPIVHAPPHCDPDRSPDRHHFISTDSFNSERRLPASSFPAQPQYQPWRPTDSSYPPPTGHTPLSRRHSHERYEHHALEAHSPIGVPPRSLPSYEQSLHSYSSGQAGPSPQPAYYGSDFSSVRSHQLASTSFTPDFNPSTVHHAPNTDTCAVPQSVPSAYSDTRPVAAPRRYSASAPYPAPYPLPRTHSPQNHHHYPGHESYSSPPIFGHQQYEANRTSMHYTIARPDDWSSTIHQPVPQIPATSILSPSYQRPRESQYRPYQEPSHREVAVPPAAPAVALGTTQSQDRSAQSLDEDFRFSSQSLSSIDDLHFVREDGIEDRSGTSVTMSGEGSEVTPAIKPKRRRADAHQIRRLMDVYARTAFPSTEERAEIARELNMTPRQVQIWFQNRRQNAKAGRPPPGSSSPPLDSQQSSAPATLLQAYPLMGQKLEGSNPDYHPVPSGRR